MADYTETLEIDHKDHSQEGGGLISPDATMVLLTWVTFFLLLAVLYKFAWKPILSALDEREEAIRQSVEEAERIREEFESLSQKREELILEAEQKGQEIIEQSRKGAAEAAKHVEKRAKQETQILLENAKRDIKDQVEKAHADLREESARIAVELASKLVEEELDEKKSQKLINKFIKEV